MDWFIPNTATVKSHFLIIFPASPYKSITALWSVSGARQYNFADALPPPSKYSATSLYFFPFSKDKDILSVSTLRLCHESIIFFPSIYNRQPSSEVKANVYFPEAVGTRSPLQRIDNGDFGKKGSGAWLIGSKLILSSIRTLGVPVKSLLS